MILFHGAFNGALGWSGLVEPGSGAVSLWIVAGTVGGIAVGLLIGSGPATLTTALGRTRE